MRYVLKHLSGTLLILMFISVFLVGCGAEPYYPQSLPTPGPDQDRVSLRLDQLRVMPANANVVLLVHTFTEGRIPWGMRYPESNYIEMAGGTERAITDIYDIIANVPLATADSTAVVVTVVSIPSYTSELAVQSVLDGISIAAKGYAGTVLKTPLGSILAEQMISVVANEVEQRIKEGEVLALYRFKMTRDGTLIADSAPAYGDAILTAQAEISRVVATSVPATMVPFAPPTATPFTPVSRPSPDNAASSAEQSSQAQLVVRQFIELQISAARYPYLDDAWLRVNQLITGRLRSIMEAYRADLLRKNVYEVQNWRDYRVLDVRLAGDRAYVETEERWYNEKYDANTKGCRYRQGPYTANFFYELQWYDGSGWVITDMQANGVPGDTVC